MATRLNEGIVRPQPATPERINALSEAARSAVQNGDDLTAISSFEELLAIDPKNVKILCNLAVLHLRSGDKERGVKMFGDAYAVAPHDPAIKRNYVSAFGIIASEKSLAGDSAAAITFIRKGLAVDPENRNLRINLANLLESSEQPSLIGDFMPGTTAAELGTHILVACMPKSGSSFLKSTLCALTGWEETFLSYAYVQNEQEIYLPYLIDVARQNTVTQQHCRATGPNTQILQAFGFRPIVLLRDLPDIVLSLSDFYDGGAVLNTFFGDVWPSLDVQGKYNLIIDHVMPWYAGFYASWERVHRRGQLDCLFLTYEEMLADKPAMIKGISDFLGLGKSVDDCATAVRAVEGDAEQTRFNKGVVGRGQRTLDDDQKARLRRLVSDYGPVDLARVGLAE